MKDAVAPVGRFELVHVLNQAGSLEERVGHLAQLFDAATSDQKAIYREKLNISWIYHDSALEGVVYDFAELKAAIDDNVVSDSSLIPVYDEIRQHKAAIDLIRTLAEKKRLSVSIDLIKKIYAELAPEEAEGKGPPKYRKDIPLHRLYFHEIAPPDKISYKLRQLIQWANAADTRRSTHPVRLAAKTHFYMMQVYPFPKHSGKVARLLMNLLLLRSGYPPAIVHATERQRYYEALKAGPNTTSNVIHEALATSIESAIRFFEDANQRLRYA